MHDLHIDKHHISDKANIPRNLAYHIYLMHICSMSSAVAVAADDPAVLMMATEKEWHLLIGDIRREYQKTRDATRISELQRRLAWMQDLIFTTKPMDDQPDADVSFATTDYLMRFPPLCHFLYATCSVPKKTLHFITSWMPPKSSVIIYEVSPSEGSI